MSTGTQVDFSPATAQALRRAGQLMRQTEQGDVHGLYEAARGALIHVADVDACYVGHYRGSNRLVIPYLYDRGKPGAPDVMSFGEFGLSHWLRTWGKTYTFAQDRGRLVHSGKSFGEDGDPRTVQDAIVAPLLEPDGSVSGMLAALSYTSRHFSQESVAVVEWLARQLRRAISRDAEDITDLDLVTTGSETALDRSADLVHAISDRLRRLQAKVDQSTSSLEGSSSAADVESVADQLRSISLLCGRFDTELALLATEPGAAAGPHAPLTGREAAVARLVVQEGLSNSEIASRLVISEKTVKTHLSHVFQKVGVSQRSELRYVASSTVLGLSEA
ncbi:helix-turn-helix transcriptional regulator [Allobranchiibius huperziae]|uniref:DNA-binding CsgD family transcriptional regulator n=1 Tax=Allobranchiibius huperziae TaxID=1874116 RepID=A0A853DEF7_9MICO|nr:LuxR C-terminal-related transcriptional regulator [Allobranchiibius huperziae]NYJ73454.1 DNA-binding CsgD family transcriptional regulator [Allobranchiibius huperziae]